jgi:hypothetical protein
MTLAPPFSSQSVQQSPTALPTAISSQGLISSSVHLPSPPGGTSAGDARFAPCCTHSLDGRGRLGSCRGDRRNFHI